MAMTRITAYFTGRVQGVGFRYTVVNTAHRFAVAGYVMNLPDGRVELVAEGERHEVVTFVNAIKQAMGSNITRTTTDTTQPTGEFGDPRKPSAFTVRY